jgi:type IV secretion system protein VirD4
VLSTVRRHLAFLDSELVANSVARSSFDIRDLGRPGATLFLRIPPEMLEAQRGLLRCWVATLIRMIGRYGSEASEITCLLDEASALGSLAALEEALVRGRSAGLRLLLAYQSDSQVRAAFKDKPTLIHDNCDTHIYLCPPSGYETAELLSKRLGEQTIQTESAGYNDGHSWQTAGMGESGQANRGWSRNWAEQARSLMKPEEILTMSPDWLLAFCRGLPPILARRVKWYADPACGTAFKRLPLAWWLLLLGVIALLVWAIRLTWHP